MPLMHSITRPTQLFPSDSYNEPRYLECVWVLGIGCKRGFKALQLLTQVPCHFRRQRRPLCTRVEVACTCIG